MTGVERKLARVQRSMDAMECGRFAELNASYCADYISWCYRYNKADRKVLSRMADQMTAIFSMQ